MRSEKLYEVIAITLEDEILNILESLYNFCEIHIEKPKELLDIVNQEISSDKIEIYAEYMVKVSTILDNIKRFASRVGLKLYFNPLEEFKFKKFSLKDLESLFEKKYKYIITLGEKTLEKIREIEELDFIIRSLTNVILELGKIKEREELAEENINLKLFLEKIFSDKIEDIRYAIDLLSENPEIFKYLDEKIIERLEDKIFSLKKKREELIKELSKEIYKVYKKLEEAKLIVEDLFNFYVIIKKLRKKNELVVIRGYIPRDRLEDFKNLFKDKPVVIFYRRVKSGPVLIRHSRLLKPFSFFIKLYGYPRYGDLDPTIVFFIFFPIFMGMALGDGGYGIILLVSSLILRYWAIKNNNEFWKNISEILIISGLWGIFWGIMFGSVFSGLIDVKPLLALLLGIEVKEGVIFPLTVEGATLIILVSIIIGIIHSNIAIIFKYLNEREKEVLIFEVIPFFMMQIAALLIFLKVTIIGYLLLFLGLGLIVFKLKIEGLIKVLEFVGGVLSYVRLAALAIATFSIDLAIHHLIEATFGKSILTYILLPFGILFAFAIHVMPSFIHAMRLHYVEMFRLFYRDTKNVFKPYCSFIYRLKWM